MKKRSSLIILLILAVLCGFAIYVYFTKSRLSTVDEDSRAFAYKDTASITRIFIADKDNHKATIERTREGWVVNNKFKCRSDAILNLLEAIKLVEVKMNVPKTARDNVIKVMSFGALKVEIYAGDEKVRQYYVGHETPDGEGSYMLLSDPETGENFRDPYVCFIPGFVGYLQPRYIADENDWRDRIVMNYIPPQISRIRVEHFAAPADSSFTIDLPDANTFVLKDLRGQQHNFDDARLRQYLVYFQNVSYEGLITGKRIALQDSLKNVGPFTTITVTGKNGSNDVFKFYRKKFTGNAIDHNVVFDFDPDRLYMSFDNDRQWAIAQYYVFGKLFMNVNYFLPPPVKK